MNIAEVCVKRPVFATVMTLVILVLGIVFYSRLPIRKYPNVEQPVITIETEFRGAGPQAVENQISKLLEGQFATIPGAESIVSNSSNEKSSITITFAPERDLDGAAADVRDRISLVKNQLPQGIHDPLIQKSDSSASAGMFIVFISDKVGTQELYDHVDKYIKPKFEMLSGVARIEVGGGNVKSMRVFVDPQKLSSLGYTPADVVEAIYSQHIQKPLGRIIGEDREFMMVADCELNEPGKFDEIVLPIKYGRDKVVKIKDIGHTEFVNEEVRDGTYFNGKKAVSVAVTKQSTANPINLSKAVYSILPEVQEMLPKGVEVIVAMDESEEIQESMNNVFHAIFESVVLVLIVVFLFLWSPSATLIPIVTIPVSLIGTFIFLSALGFSINILTLLAMVLAVGLVVDDAIVVLENVHRHIEKGATKKTAAIKATQEIMFAVIAMTFTLATAYIPVALTPGTIGGMLKEFALALASSVIISGFVALTLSPMMCSKLLRDKHDKVSDNFITKYYPKQQEILKKIDDFYLHLLNKMCNHPAIISCSALCILGLGMFLLYSLPSENFPTEDSGYVNIRGEAPTGSTYSYVEKNALAMDELMKTMPDTRLRYVRVDSNSVSGFLTLVPWDKRTNSAKDIAEKLNESFLAISGVTASAYTFSGSGDEGVGFVLQTNQGYHYLARYGHGFAMLLRSVYQGLDRGIMSTLLPDQEEYVVSVDRDKAAAVGITMNEVLDAIETSIKGRKAGNVQRESYRDEIFVQLNKNFRETTEALKYIYVRSPITDGNKEVAMVPVIDLVDIQTKLSPSGLYHNDKMLAAKFTAQIAKGYSLGQVVEDIKKLKEQYLPDTMILSFTGETKKFLTDSKQMVFVFLLALVFVYLVLAAQFESFLDPLIIMLSVPLAVTGALVLLKVIPGGTLNIYSRIGLVTLIGLITKHGILIIDFANKIREEGKDALEAVKMAANLRLRPILMTTAAMVLGAFPLAYASGAGAGARRQIGYSIIGGMSFGTVFTLLILPVMYIIFMKLKDKVAQKFV